MISSWASILQRSNLVGSILVVNSNDEIFCCQICAVDKQGKWVEFRFSKVWRLGKTLRWKLALNMKEVKIKIARMTPHTEPDGTVSFQDDDHSYLIVSVEQFASNCPELISTTSVPA